MEFLGIGPLELLIIILIGLIVLGPKDIVKAGQTAGRFLRKVVTSPYWSSFQRTSRELKNLPNRLIREAGLEEMQKDIPNLTDDLRSIGKDLSNLTASPVNSNQGASEDTKAGYVSWLTPPGKESEQTKTESSDSASSGMAAWITSTADVPKQGEGESDR
jgi:Sec-independent protein translocase protein TatA